MSYRIDLFFPCHALPALRGVKRVDPFPPSLNARLHWAKRAKLNANWRARVRAEVGNAGPRTPLEKAHLTLIRHSAVKADPDNIITSFKALIDGLTDAGVLADDREVTLKPLWKKAPRGKGAVEIIVEEVSA